MCAIIDYSSEHAYFDKLYIFRLDNITMIKNIDNNFIFNNNNMN